MGSQRNGTSRKQGENIPGGHSRNVMPRGNRRYGLREIVKDLVMRDFSQENVYMISS